MTRTEKYPETPTFHYFNNNPKSKIGCDCVVRAVSIFLNISWEQCVREMTECGIKHGLVLNDTKTIEVFLKSKGYEKQKQPRKEDGTKYTLKEFCKKLTYSHRNYLVNIASHTTVVVNSKVWDIWDCTDKSVCNWWVR